MTGESSVLVGEVGGRGIRRGWQLIFTCMNIHQEVRVQLLRLQSGAGRCWAVGRGEQRGALTQGNRGAVTLGGRAKRTVNVFLRLRSCSGSKLLTLAATHPPPFNADAPTLRHLWSKVEAIWHRRRLEGSAADFLLQKFGLGFAVRLKKMC